MLQQTIPFSIYNASAGSGKTFTLVKLYLKKIIESNKPDYFRNILAITFTNKAVGEMKQRLLESLLDFSHEVISDKNRPLFEQICLETGLAPAQVQERAQQATRYILHNYSSFEVETIDRFNHRLIRTFARDLKLAVNFEVELDTATLMAEAVDNVISMVGIDQEITDLILAFSFEKMQDDRSWDITYDLLKISKILYNENNLKHIEKIKTKTIKDFQVLKKNLKDKQLFLEKETISLGQEFLNLLTTQNIEPSDVLSFIFNYFQKIALGNFNVIDNTRVWQKNMGESPLYPKKTSQEAQAKIDQLFSKIVLMFENSKALIHQRDLLKALLKEVNSISLINTLYQEFLKIQEERNILAISEFNARIHNEIKQQPAPFIYERLGEKYNHFFIDEFQDTSQLQWENLIPLIDSALSQGDELFNAGSLLIVGDAKQSIYRWRGGNPEQFIDLYNCFNPFAAAAKQVETLHTNYRSCEQIIAFNNAFFSFAAGFLNAEKYKDLYLNGNNQKATSKKGGYVSLAFIDAPKVEDGMEIYPQKVLAIIKEQVQKGYALKDICILVRKNSQGAAIAAHLAKNNIDVISSEALLLDNEPAIGFIINLLKIVQNFENDKAKAAMSYFLHTHLNIEKETHIYLSEMLKMSSKQLEKEFNKQEIFFSFEDSSTQPLFQFCEHICSAFKLRKNSRAHIDSFMEFVYEFSLSQKTTIEEFLELWDSKKDNLSIELSDQLNAVNIYTIHKAKGLEFLVVIYPFADENRYDFNNDTLWFPLDKNLNSDITELLISVNKNIENYGEVGKMLYQSHTEKAELDTLNLVYVALTRAVEQLFVISNKKNIHKQNFTASIFYQFLSHQQLWNDDNETFEFGSPEKPVTQKTKQQPIKEVSVTDTPKAHHNQTFIKIAAHKSLLWNTKKERAIEKGDLMHHLLAKIKTKNDLDISLNYFLTQGTLSQDQGVQIKNLLEKIIAHPSLFYYFEEGQQVANEKDIFSNTKEIIRPDRINFLENNQVTIIDYKTGKKTPEHLHQIKNYATILEQMGYQIKELLLVYIKETIEVIQASRTI